MTGDVVGRLQDKVAQASCLCLGRLAHLGWANSRWHKKAISVLLRRPQVYQNETSKKRTVLTGLTTNKC